MRRTGRQDVLHAWIYDQRARLSSGNLGIRVAWKQFLLVTDPALSAHVLAAAPAEEGYVEGSLKRSSMAFLAPLALTISHGAEWRRRREFNEAVLWSDSPELRRSILRAVHAAFASPVESADEIRGRMRQVMLEVVFGGHAPARVADDVATLIGVVGNPLRRLLLGWRYRETRRGLYDELRALRQSVPATCLLGVARRTDGLDPDEAVEQVPHWMFPFIGSASDLLLRTLSIVGTRPDALRRIEEEVAQGALDDPETIDRLTYLEASILESGRLFPPVSVTFHTPPHGDTFEGHSIAAGAEVLHYFPFSHRDEASSRDVHQFDPTRVAPSNLFLSGSRECPGRELILFVLKSAAAILLVQQQLRADAPALASDLLPLSYEERGVHFYSTAPPSMSDQDRRPA